MMAKRDPVTDAEEAAIQAGIAADPDNPEWTDAEFRDARPFVGVFSEMAARLRRASENLSQT